MNQPQSTVELESLEWAVRNGNNLMTCASKLKLDRGIPGERILYLSGRYHM